MTAQRSPSRGFTLVELLVSLAILATLASGAMAVGELAVKRSREQELRSALREIREAIDAYKQAADGKRIRVAADESGYPPDLSALTRGVPLANDARGRKLYFLRRLPRDPMAEPGPSAEATWGLRSYDSDFDNPQPGRDVFDVHSRSDKVGMNGLPYSRW